MLSVIVYGRNDNYGYNLHKRAALSLNTLGELLSDASDEIVFVDYNTPDDFPTFPEAIQDTLTPRAKHLLRILRVRPHHHARFQAASSLQALEPIARNVGLRRTSSECKWVLSTNTDMIFSPSENGSLTDVVRNLEDGFYHLPRFELPESLWETLDRSSPRDVIKQVTDWGRALHLNEIVRAADIVGFDAPGDFQLMLRKDAFELHGFHEGMLLGWHVDSNLAKRFVLKYSRLRDLMAQLRGYHCDHTRQVTPAHRPGRTENDMMLFVDQVETPDIPLQAGVWGLANEHIEEVRLVAPATYVSRLTRAIGAEMSEPTSIAYRSESYDHVTYDPRHVLPFLVDVLTSYPRDIRIGWFGSRRDTLELFCKFRTLSSQLYEVAVAIGFDILGPTLPEGAIWVRPDDIATEVDLVIFDFGLADLTAESAIDLQPERERVANGLRFIVRAERRRIGSGRTPRRIITINAAHGRYENVVRDLISAPISPIATRLMQGYVKLAAIGPQNLLRRMHIGGAGRHSDGAITNILGSEGFVVYGGYLLLDSGSYELTLSLRAAVWSVCRVEIICGDRIVDCRLVREDEFQTGEAKLQFVCRDPEPECLEEPVWEFRIWSDGCQEVSLVQVSIEALSAALDPVVTNILPLVEAGSSQIDRQSLVTEAPTPLTTAADLSILSELMLGPVGQRTGNSIIAASGQPGYIVQSGLRALEIGSYYLELFFQTAPSTKGLIRIEVYLNGVLIAYHRVSDGELAVGRAHAHLHYSGAKNGTPENPAALEIRIWQHVRGHLALLDLVLKRQDHPAYDPHVIRSAADARITAD